MKGNDFSEIESAFKKISHKLNLEFFRKSSSISNEKKRISSKMQINCIFNHNQNKEIIPKSGIFFFQKSISNLLLSWKKKIKYREKSIYYRMSFRLTPFSTPSGENENLVIMRNVRSFLLNFMFFFLLLQMGGTVI